MGLALRIRRRPWLAAAVTRGGIEAPGFRGAERSAEENMASTGHEPKGDHHEGKIRRRRFFGVPLVLTDGDAVRRVAWTDGEGRYEFSDLPGGEYLLGLGLRAGQRRARAVETRRLSIRERQDLTFNMRRRLGLVGKGSREE